MTGISEHFNNYIYPKVIAPAIKVAMSQVDPDFAVETGLCRYIEEEEYSRLLSNLYEEKRDWLKDKYFHKYSSRKLLDLHKIAAVQGQFYRRG